MNNAEHIAELVESMGEGTGVVSTFSADGGIDSAVVYFTLTRDLHLYFFTRAKSKKFQNISANSNISFVAYSEAHMKTFQLRGDASLVNDPQEQSIAFEAIMKIARERSHGNPPITQMMESEIMVVKIIPLWARFSNFSSSKDGERIEYLKSDVF